MGRQESLLLLTAAFLGALPAGAGEPSPVPKEVLLDAGEATSEAQRAAFLAELRQGKYLYVWSDLHDLFVSNYDGTKVGRITNTRDLRELHPRFSPDGKYLAFIQSSAQGDQKSTRAAYYVVESERIVRTELTEVHTLAWSADGKNLFGARERKGQKGLAAWNLQKGQVETVCPGVEGIVDIEAHPTLPEVVVFARRGLPWRFGIGSCRLDGSALRCYATRAVEGHPLRRLQVGKEVPGGACHPALSKDGKWVAWNQNAVGTVLAPWEAEFVEVNPQMRYPKEVKCLVPKYWWSDPQRRGKETGYGDDPSPRWSWDSKYLLVCRRAFRKFSVVRLADGLRLTIGLREPEGAPEATESDPRYQIFLWQYCFAHPAARQALEEILEDRPYRLR